jgi:hypothetical protein
MLLVHGDLGGLPVELGEAYLSEPVTCNPGRLGIVPRKGKASMGILGT